MSAKPKKPLVHRIQPKATVASLMAARKQTADDEKIASLEADRKLARDEAAKLRAEVARLTQLNQGLRVMVFKVQEHFKQMTDVLNGALRHLDTLSDDVIALDKEGVYSEHLLAMRTFFLENIGKIRKIREES